MTDFAPNWYSEEALQTVKKGYLQPDETVYDMYWRLAETAASYYGDSLPDLTEQELKTQLYTLFCSGWLSPAAPVAANFGTEQGLPVSCFGQSVPNSIDGIFSSMREGAMLSKNGGGLGVDLSNVVGPSAITTWAKGFDYMANSVSQGGVRRGAVALYLDINHPDIEAFLHSKDLLKGDHREKLDCNIAVILDRAFMAKLRIYDNKAIALFSQILELRMKFGSPYIMFKHNAQDADPECYKANGLSTEHSQLCLLGEELVITKQGPKTIEALAEAGKTVDIFDGRAWVQNNRFRQIGYDTNFVEISLESGAKFTVTQDHRLWLDNGITCISAKHAKKGYKLWRHENLESHGNTEVLNTYELGYEHTTVNWLNWSKLSKLKYLAGLLEANNATFPFVSVNSSSLQAMLNSFGIKSIANGNTLEVIGKHKAKLLAMLHLGTKQYIEQPDVYYEQIQSVKLIKYDEPKPVYCTTVAITQGFALLNGSVTGNCAEIMLHSDEAHTYTCVLSSLNADKYFEWAEYKYKQYSVPMFGILFLDAVNEEFIKRGKAKPGLQKAVNSAIKGRPLALGTLGLHSLYMQQGLPFESKEAYALNEQIHKHIAKDAKIASKLLAEALGEPEWCKGFGIRNTHLTAIAPTTTNSVLCNAGTPGIEPQISNYYVMAGAKGSFVRQNKYLAKVLEKHYGEGIEQAWTEIRSANGSVQNLAKLSTKEKQVFKTAYEIGQMHIIRQAADRQKYICQGQSLNLFFYANANAEYIADTHLLAEELGLKSLYYVRSTSAMNTAIANQEKPIVVYSRDNCPYCHKAKALLCKLNLPYTEYHKPQGKVPEIWLDGAMLEDGYTSLATLLGSETVLADANLLDTSSCTGCEG